MSPAERALWQRLQRRAGIMTPDLAIAMLLAFAALRDGLADDDVVRAIQFGVADRLLDQLLTEAARMAAYDALRERLRRGIVRGVTYWAADIPVPPASRSLTIGFDMLNPKAIEAVRELETRVITTLQADARATLLQVAERGIRAGTNPRTWVAELRAAIGLAPHQEQWLANYRQALLQAHFPASERDPLGYQLRDKRFDARVAKARASGEPIPAEQVGKMADAYRRKAIAHNAETNARTAALDAQKLAQRLAWEDAIAKGIVDRDRLRKRWVGVMDEREREEHIAMEGQTVGFDEPFSNGQTIPGDSDFNCRCIARYMLA